MPYQLIPVADPSQPIALDKAIIIFGRHPECDVCITSSRKVSRKHCAVAQVNNSFVVRDLGSMNGLRVNGKNVNRSAKLRLGDELCVGDVRFHLKEAGTNGKKAKSTKPVKKKKKKKPTPNHMISQDIPVIIPDEEQSFVVEESIIKSPTDSEIPIQLSQSDIVEEDDSEYEIETLD